MELMLDGQMAPMAAIESKCYGAGATSRPQLLTSQRSTFIERDPSLVSLSD